MWNPGVQFNGNQVNQGIMSAAGVLSESLVKTLNEIEQQKAANSFSSLVVNGLSGVKSQSGQPYVTPDLLLEFEKASSRQKMEIAHGLQTNATMDAARAAAASKAQEDAARTNLLWAQGNNEWSDGGSNGVFNPPQNEQDAAHEAGLFGVHTSKNTIQYHEKIVPPELDENGNPIYTQDGTMYKAKGGVLRPVTDSMRTARDYWLSNKKAVDDAQKRIKEAEQQKGFSPLHPTTWFGNSQPTASPTPPPPTAIPAVSATTAVKVSTTAEAQALPPGTRYQTPDGKTYLR
ncbi:MAG: hypothetical protein ABI925_11250 [Verrucomicrobiota bacterium]